jgi:hypothetical protein
MAISDFNAGIFKLTSEAAWVYSVPLSTFCDRLGGK